MAMLASCRPASYIPPLRSTACKPRICYVIRSADAGARTWPTGDSPESPEHASQAPQDSKPKPFLQKLKTWIFGGPLDKERIKSLGLGAFLAYGCASWPRFVSNVTYGTCVTIGWASHVAATGVTPFSGGQLGAFLARIAGLLALQQLLRPIRFSCAIALTPVVDRMLQWLQKRMGFSRLAAFFCLIAALAVVTLTGFAVALTTVTVWNMPK